MKCSQNMTIDEILHYLRLEVLDISPEVVDRLEKHIEDLEYENQELIEEINHLNQVMWD